VDILEDIFPRTSSRQQEGETESSAMLQDSFDANLSGDNVGNEESFAEFSGKLRTSFRLGRVAAHDGMNLSEFEWTCSMRDKELRWLPGNLEGEWTSSGTVSSILQEFPNPSSRSNLLSCRAPIGNLLLNKAGRTPQAVTLGDLVELVREMHAPPKERLVNLPHSPPFENVTQGFFAFPILGRGSKEGILFL
jgi:hypothetical protein